MNAGDNISAVPKHASLAERAFGEGAERLVTVNYPAHEDALRFLSSALRQPNGVGLLYGPSGSGKTTIARELVGQVSRDAAVALVDGAQLKPRRLLTSMLLQYGLESHAEPDDELLRMIEDFACQQVCSYKPPVLVVDNVEQMFPKTLRVLNALAALDEQGQFALRIVLTGHEGLNSLAGSDGLADIARRNPGTHLIGPLSANETLTYLHARLRAAGSDHADTVFPPDVCERLRAQSNGWPGQLNHFALEAMERAADFPLNVVDTYSPQDFEKRAGAEILALRAAGDSPAPRVVISRDGETVSEYTLQGNKVLIGRSDFADIVIEDEFVSKLHAALMLFDEALLLIDLNSANGTTVNAVKTHKSILQDNDVISLGRYRLTVQNAPAIGEEMAEYLNEPGTLRMRKLMDLRRQHARKAVAAAKRDKQD